MINVKLEENLRRVGGLTKLWEDYKGAYPNIDELNYAHRDADEGAIASTYDNNKLYMFANAQWQEIIGTGGVTTLNSLSDTTVTSPTNLQILQYNGTTNVWENKDLALALDGLTDVVTTGATTGQFLKYNGTNWVPDTATVPTQLSDLSDVDAPSPTNGNVLIWNSTDGEWQPSAPSNPTVIGDLTDVDNTAPTDGQVLTWDSAGSQWEPQTPVTPATAMDDLSDVTLTSVVTDDILKWNGTAFVNASLTTVLLGGDYKGSYAVEGDLTTAYPSPSGNQWALVEGITYIHNGSGAWESTLYEIYAVAAATETELETLTNFDTNNEYIAGSIGADDLVAGKKHKHSSIDGISYECLEDDTWIRKDNRMQRESLGTIFSPTDSDASASTTVAKVSITIPFDCKVIDFVGGCMTAPTGSTAVFDIHYEATPAGGTGVSIFSTKPTIDAAGYTTSQAATPSVLSTTEFSKGSMIHFFIDQVGSTTAGRGYSGFLNVYRID